jgi:hypothetical protein
MRNTIFAGLALTALAALPAKAAPAPVLPFEEPSVSTLATLAAQSQGAVEVWMGGRRDLYRPGERMQVYVRPEYDGYVAVFHIDTNGDVDILYPRSESDDGWVEGGRTLHLGSRGESGYLRSRGGYGMGYIMAVSLEQPMELYRVRELYGVRTAGWDGNRGVFGDPFYAMDEMVRAIVPDEWYGYESVDYTTYHVGQRRYRYPRYACYDGYGDWYNYRGVYWDDCDRVRILLVSYPYYYDAYRWHGSRRVYYDRYYRTVPVRNRPLHGYKERTNGYAPPARTASRRPTPAERPGSGGSAGDRPRTGGSADRPTGGGSADRPREGSVSRRPEPRSTAPGSVRGSSPRSGAGDAAGRSVPGTRGTRPTTRGTRQEQQDDAQPPQQDRPVEPSRDRPTFQRRPQNEGGNAQPRRESPPSRSAEPRRETPPSRSAEPRRESPPARSAEPRRESPPARSAEPRRESRPPSSSAGSSSRGSSSSGSSSRPSSSSSGSSRSSDGGSSRSSAPGRRP